MPLTLEMMGPAENPIGKMIIDRNNIIFVFNDKKKAAIQTKLLLDFLQESEFQYDPLPIFTAIDQLRHEALDHVSAYDKRINHVHISLNEEVTSEFIIHFFSALATTYLNRPRPNELLSLNCIQEMKEISTAYFTELRGGGPAIDFEEYYREMKEHEYREALNTDVRNQITSPARFDSSWDRRSRIFRPIWSSPEIQETDESVTIYKPQ